MNSYEFFQGWDTVSLATNRSDPDPGISLRNFYHCGIAPILTALQDQPPWRRFPVTECF